jgi:hypothetical protein
MMGWSVTTIEGGEKPLARRPQTKLTDKGQQVRLLLHVELYA